MLPRELIEREKWLMQKEWLRQATYIRYCLLALAMFMGVVDYVVDVLPADWRLIVGASLPPLIATAYVEWRRRQDRVHPWHFWGMMGLENLVIAVIIAAMGTLGYFGVPFLFLAAVGYSLTIPRASRLQLGLASLYYPIARMIGLYLDTGSASVVLVLVETVCFTSIGWLAIAGPMRFTYRVRGARRALGALARGDFSVRLPARALDDLGFLAVSFNDTAERLGQVVAALENEVAERSRAEAALRNSQEALSHQAFHDPLTGLANRARFRERLARTLNESSAQRTVVLAIDLDGFKTVNDTLGHAAGDRLLRDVAQRLLNATRGGDLVARLGGDEFAILLPEVYDNNQAAIVADRALRALQSPFSLGDRLTTIGASIGIARGRAWEAYGEVTAEHATLATLTGERPIRDPVDLLLYDADLALYHAKTQGKGRAAFFDASLHDAALERRALQGELRNTLDNDGFTLHYQPIVSLTDGQLVGVEALLRWTHPIRGPLSPNEFIPMAEECGLIVPLGRWVLREACAQLARWQARSIDGPPLTMSVNVSSRQLQDPGFVRDVQQALQDSCLAASSLMLELTESSVIHQPEAARERMIELKTTGVQLAIDDFGTGYSALSYLRHFPIDVLKIDKAFIDGVANGGAQAALARTIVTLGEALSLRTLAEGIESAEQQQALVAMGCDLGQGYYFSPPVPAHEIDRLLTKVEAHAGRA